MGSEEGGPQVSAAAAAWFEALARLPAFGVALLAPDGTVRSFGSAHSTTLGHRTEDLAGTAIVDLVHPEQQTLVRQAIADLGTEPGLSRSAVLRVRQGDGTWRWVDAAATSMGTAEVTAIAVIGHDLSRHHREAEALREEASRLQALVPSAPLPPREGEQPGHEGRDRTLLDSALDVVHVSGVDGNIESISPSRHDVLGYRPEDVVGRNLSEVIHPDDAELADAAYRRVLADPGVTHRFTVRLRSASGEWRWVDARTTNRLDDRPSPGVAVYLDATEPEVALREGRRLTRLADRTTDFIAIAEPDGTLVYANAPVRRFLGVDEQDQIERFDPAAHLPEADQRIWQESVVPSLRRNRSWRGELTALDHTGRSIAMEAEVIVHLDQRGRVDMLSCIARDVSERKALEASLTHQASHDPLTGLPNRTLFFDRLEVAVSRAARSHRYPAVLFLDLDHFKVVNDSLGHGLGDRLLVELADRLSTAVRPGDTVARFGGDEFVVLCEDLHEEHEAVIVSDRVTAIMNTPVVIDDSEIFVSASIGIAYAGDPQTAEELLRDADAAMYEAKERGRSRAEVFDSGMRTRAVDRMALEGDLRHAIERDELRVHYQPLISLALGRITGVEALLRWQHPERGLLLPGAFLAIAEQNHTIVPIGRWLAAEACRTVDRLQVALPRLDPLVLSINLSADQLAHPELLDDLRNAMRAGHLPPDRLDLDLTEEVILADLGLTDRTFDDLKALGVRLAVDDFGRSFSTLGYFRRLPVDLLKVDHNFVAALGKSEGDASVVGAVVELAHSLGLQTIAEGVETAGQLSELRRLGCDMAQGYFIARPLPAAELTELLATDPVWGIFEGGLRSGIWSGWIRPEAPKDAGASTES